MQIIYYTCTIEVFFSEADIFPVFCSFIKYECFQW